MCVGDFDIITTIDTKKKLNQQLNETFDLLNYWTALRRNAAQSCILWNSNNLSTKPAVKNIAISIWHCCTFLGIASIVGCVLVILVSRFQFDRLILHFCCTMTYGITTIVVAYSSDKVRAITAKVFNKIYNIYRWLIDNIIN